MFNEELVGQVVCSMKNWWAGCVFSEELVGGGGAV